MEKRKRDLIEAMCEKMNVLIEKAKPILGDSLRESYEEKLAFALDKGVNELRVAFIGLGKVL